MDDVSPKNDASSKGDVLPDNEPALRAIAMPADTNPHGDIFGGWLLCQMDLAGTHRRHAARRRPRRHRRDHRR